MSQDGNGGGFGEMFTRSAQRETVTASLSTQLQGWFWATTFAVIALFIVLAVAVAVGPASVWLAVQVGIIALAVNRVRSIGNYEMGTEGDRKFCRFLFVFYIVAALGVSLAWWFAPLQEYWPPILQVQSPWKLIVIVLFSSIPLGFSALMSFTFIVGAVNPATYAPYLPRNPNARLRDALMPIDPPEYAEDDEAGGITAADIAGMINEAVKNRPIIQRESRFLERKPNGNPLHQSPDPGNGDRIEQDASNAYVETDTRESDGVMTMHIVEHGQQSMDVPVETARHYVEKAWPDRFGSGRQAWNSRGLSDTSQKVIRKMLEIYGLIQPANGEYRETITWLLPRDKTLEEFDRLFAKSA